MGRRQPYQIAVPPEVRFADLRLSRDPSTGAVRFDWSPLERICRESEIDIALLREQHEDNVAGLIVAWYQHHREAGGEPDPIADQLIREVLDEDQPTWS